MDKALIILLNLRSFTTGKNVVVVGSGVDVVAGVWVVVVVGSSG